MTYLLKSEKCIHILMSHEKTSRVETLITINHDVVRCSAGGRKFPADFAVWRRIGFCSIASHPYEFYKIGNLFVAMEFSATTNSKDHPAGCARPRNFYLSLPLLPQLFFL